MSLRQRALLPGITLLIEPREFDQQILQPPIVFVFGKLRFTFPQFADGQLEFIALRTHRRWHFLLRLAAYELELVRAHTVRGSPFGCFSHGADSAKAIRGSTETITVVVE